MELRIAAERSPNTSADSANDPHPLDDAEDALRFAGFEFDLRRGELHAADGTPVALRPKTEALLRRFLADPGRLLAKDTLMAALWPTAVVTDDSLVQCVGDLRLALGDSGQTLIRTVPRRGYRLDAEVERVSGKAPIPRAPTVAGAVAAGLASASTPTATATATRVAEAMAGAVADAPAHASVAVPSPATSPSVHAPAPPVKLPAATGVWPWLAALAIAIALCAAAVARLSAPRVHIDEAIAARATVAIMPLAVAGDEPELRQAADAVADEITEQLSRRIGMRGIGRTATAPFATGSSSAPDTIARKLKATHVLTGRVARSAGDRERIEIDVQLVAVATNEVLWARRFERPLGGGAEHVYDIGVHVANAARYRGGKFDSLRAEMSERSTDPVDLTLLGWADLDRRKTIDDVYRARGRFETALASDPESVLALAGLASTFEMERSDRNLRVMAEQVAEHERIVERARRLAPDDGTTLMLWSAVQTLHGRPDLALPALDKVVRIIPSYPRAHLLRGRVLLMLGRAEEVRAETDRVLQLEQNLPRNRGRAFALAAEAALMLGRNEEAYELARRSVAEFPFDFEGRGVLAAVDALAGRGVEAKVDLAELLKLWPSATVARYDDPYPSTQPVYLAQRQRLYEGLRKAGLPDR